MYNTFSDFEGVGLKVFIRFHFKLDDSHLIQWSLKSESIDRHNIRRHIRLFIFEFNAVKENFVSHFKDINNVITFDDFNRKLNKSECFVLQIFFSPYNTRIIHDN